MKHKKGLAAVWILGLLAIAFFCGGYDQHTLTVFEESNNETYVMSKMLSSQKLEARPDGPKTKRVDENEQEIGTEGPGEASINHLGETEQSVVAIEKKPEKSASKTVEQVPVKEEHPQVVPKTEENNQENKSDRSIPDPKPERDQYLTDPVGEGNPNPVEWQDLTVNKDEKMTCTLSVICKTILNNMDKFNKNKLEVLPADGIIYKSQEVTFYEGESVFDVLLREMKKNKIHMEFEMTPIYNSNYIEGIHNIYEFDCGELSGWMYKVNGWFPNYGCSRYALKGGDVIEWIYTCDLGRDIGGGMVVEGEE